jgi:hypothetical protein
MIVLCVGKGQARSNPSYSLTFAPPPNYSIIQHVLRKPLLRLYRFESQSFLNATERLITSYVGISLRQKSTTINPSYKVDFCPPSFSQDARTAFFRPIFLYSFNVVRLSSKGRRSQSLPRNRLLLPPIINHVDRLRRKAYIRQAS